MFFKNLKNIFVSINNRNIHDAEKYAEELRYTIYSLQNGGARVFDDILKKDLDPIVEKLGLNKKYFELLLQVTKFIINYIEKLQIEDVDTLNRLLKETRNIVQQRLEKERS
jgi:hypothetical protein